MKTAQFIEEIKSVKERKTSGKKRKMHPNSLKAIEATKWPKGYCPNPGGKNQHDVAKEIAQAIFSGNPEDIYAAMLAGLRKGNAYTFQVLAERAYGKLKETKEIKHKYQEDSDAELNERIKQLERDLGLAEQIDDAGRVARQAIRTAATGE